MYHCPVTFRVFNENSHIVAIRTSGNVYSYEVMGRGGEGLMNWKGGEEQLNEDCIIFVRLWKDWIWKLNY